MRQRPRLPSPLFGPPTPQRHIRGKGRRYVADVVEQVRELIVGTTWPEAEIARRVGIGVGTVHAWKVRHGWVRPADVSVSTRKVAVARAGFSRRSREGLCRIEARAAAEVLRLCRAPESDRAVLARTVALVVGTRAELGPRRVRESSERRIRRGARLAAAAVAAWQGREGTAPADTTIEGAPA